MAQLPNAVKEYMAEIGSRGGQAHVPKGFAKLTPEQRSENARKAVAARWAKRKPKAKSKGKNYVLTSGTELPRGAHGPFRFHHRFRRGARPFCARRNGWCSVGMVGRYTRWYGRQMMRDHSIPSYFPAQK
jgi:hypothetical protein